MSVKVSQEVIAEGLSGIQKTAEGSTFAYTALSLVGKGLQEVNDQVQRYEHVRDLDLSGNKLTSVDKLRNLKWLQSLTAKDNKIELCHLMSETKAQLQFLTHVDLTGNKIQKVRPLLARKLQKVVLDNNLINEVDFGAKGHDQLKVLSLNKNKLVNLQGITCLKLLTELHLNQNEITSLRGISGCNELRILNLNQNKLEGFDDVPNMPALEELSMTHCPITNIAEIGKLIQYKNLKSLNLLETPLNEEQGETIKKEVLILLDGLAMVSFNGEEVTKEDIEEAKQEKADRIKAAEEERKAREEEEAAKKAEEEAAAAEAAKAAADAKAEAEEEQ